MSSFERENSLRRVCIVVPTYNEAANIEQHLDRIFAVAAEQYQYTISVLVVDDSSPDGTSRIVQRYRRSNSNVHLLVRLLKEGLGVAYVAGFRYALEKLDPDVIVEMDADGQHDPRDLFRLLAEMESGADFVIGSRYVEGGRISEGWSIHRRLTSAAARTVTKALLNLSGIQDCSGGYRAIRASLLRKVPLDRLEVKGYAFQAVLLEEALHHGALIREVPIAFGVRAEGESKMGLKDVVEGGIVCLRVRTRRMLSKPAKRVALTERT